MPGADLRVAQGRCAARFALEPEGPLRVGVARRGGRGGGTAETLAADRIHLPEAALSEQAEDLAVTEEVSEVQHEETRSCVPRRYQ
jgi:hypothetical protein